MNWDRAEGNWKQLIGKVKEQWGKLTDDDLMVINGKQDQLVGRVQERYGNRERRGGAPSQEVVRQHDGLTGSVGRWKPTVPGIHCPASGVGIAVVIDQV